MGSLAAMTTSSGAVDFINDARLESLIQAGPPDAARVRDVITKGLAKQALTVEETAALLSRILRCRKAGVPITNYGLTIACSLGIFERALGPFPAALDAYHEMRKAARS